MHFISETSTGQHCLHSTFHLLQSSTDIIKLTLFFTVEGVFRPVCRLQAAGARKLLCNYFHFYLLQILFFMCWDSQSSYSQNTCHPPTSCHWMCFTGSLQDEWPVSVVHHSPRLNEPKGRTWRTAEKPAGPQIQDQLLHKSPTWLMMTEVIWNQSGSISRFRIDEFVLVGDQHVRLTLGCWISDFMRFNCQRDLGHIHIFCCKHTFLCVIFSCICSIVQKDILYFTAVINHRFPSCYCFSWCILKC